MRPNSTQHQPEQMLHFSSFNQKDDAALQEIISCLRKAGTSVAVSAESQAISEHYVREIGSNFLDKGQMMGEIKRGPTDRSGIITSINRALSKSQQKMETSREHRELWIYYANAADDLTAVQLAENLVRQFHDCNISIVIVCSAIVVRSSKFHSWLKKTKVPQFNFDRPSRQDMDDYLLRAEASGSVHLARSLLKSINEGIASPLQDADLIDITDIRQDTRSNHKPAAIVPDRSNRPGRRKGKAIHRQQLRSNKKPLRIGSYFGIFLLTLLCPALLAAILFDSEDWSALKAVVFEVAPSDDGLVSTNTTKVKAATDAEVEKQTTANEQSELQAPNKSTTESFTVRSATISEPKGTVAPDAITRIDEEATVKPEKNLTFSQIIQVENVAVTTQETNAPIESVSQKPTIRPKSDENLKYLQYGAFESESSARRLMRLEHYNDSGFFVAQKKNGLWAVLSGPYDDNLARELIENSESSDSFFMVQKEDVLTNS